MSQSPQQAIDTFNQINLNAIKNTKLFQKFMQNKSGLVSNGSTVVNNKSMQSGKLKKTEEQEGEGDGKWGRNDNSREEANNKKMVVNLKKQPKKEIENDINTQNSGRDYGKQNNNKHERYEAQEEKRPQIIREVASSQFQSQTAAQTQNNPNRRKRNFNANSYNHQQPIRNQQFEVEQSYQSVSHNVYSEPVTQNFGGKKKKLSNQRLNVVEQERENSFTYSKPSYKPVQQQKYTNIQSSPGRSNNNTYSHSYNMPVQKSAQNYQHSYELPNTTTAISYSEQQYKQKYDQLQKKYNQLKQQLKDQSKHHKKQFSQWEHEIQLLKQKLFDVQSRQDSLLIQNQRLKQKFESETLTKMKTQQENKQLTFRIKELEDQLSMRESIVKQKSDETAYWKVQVDGMKQELNVVRLGLEKKMDEYSLLYGDYQIVRKERDNKDFLLQDLRRNIAGLVQENGAAKDEIFKLVTKLYQMEQENQTLRNDLKRQQLDTSQIHNYMKDLQQQNSSHNVSRDRVQSSYIQRERLPQQNHYEPHMAMERSIGHRNESMVMAQQNRQQIGRGSLTEQERSIGNGEKPTRKRGEFARQRGPVTRNQKPQRDQRPLNVNQNHQKSINDQRSFPTSQQTTKPPAYMNNNKMARIQQISQELQKIKDMKAMNGAIRRKKIDLERELQELEDK